jgi:magnesium chelatase subunit I
MSNRHVTTLGALRRTSYRPRSIKDEIRANAIRFLREGADPFPGVIGYEKTVVPEVMNAMLSRHDFILLGLRGQAKTRLVRALPRLLDPAVPAIAGSPLHDDPLQPISAFGRRVVQEAGDDTPIVWLEPAQRFHEKLATPDVTIADLIGDVDPIKAAREGRSLDDEEVISYGLVPRSHRGIFALNELPDLAPRIQVGLLNIMEEKDVQIRGFPVRLPVDVLMVFTANPEDYTNRGSIITPLKDRIDSQIHTHYPATLDEAMRITEQEAWTQRGVHVHVPPFLRRIVDEVAFLARESEFVDQASGVSARVAISAYENLLSNLERRALLLGETSVVARVCDLAAIVPALTGKVELAYEGEQEGALTVCRDLLGKAVRKVFLEHFPDPKGKHPRSKKARGGGQDSDDGDGEDHPAHRPAPREADDSVYAAITNFFGGGGRVQVSDVQSEAEYREQLAAVPGLETLARKHIDAAPEELGPAMELVLEGLYQSSFVAKENLDRATFYSDMLMRMFQGLGKGRTA